MANELLLINPRRRKRRTTRRRRRRNPNARASITQTAARRGLTRRANPNGNAGRRPVARRAARRRAARRQHRYYYGNPARMTMQRVINDVVIPAAQAGAGALALDVLWGYVPVPVEWKTGNLRHVVKGGGAIVIGMLAQQVLGARIGKNIALGALTVTFHAAMRDMVAQFAPQIPLGYVGAGTGAGQYGGPATYNYPAGGTTQADALGVYVGTGAPQAIPMPVKRESENMGYYTTT